MQLNTDEAILQIQEVYHAQYDPGSCLDIWDQLLACEAVAEATPIKNKNTKMKVEGSMLKVKVQGAMVATSLKYDYGKILEIFTTKKQKSKENLAFLLSQALNDPESLSYYEKLISKHRTDFLRNCLLITLIADRQGKVVKTKGAYFTGVLKNKIAFAERLKKYKQNHKT